MNFGFSPAEAAWRDELADFVAGYGAAEYAALRAEARHLDTERHAASFHAELCRRGWVGVGWPVDGVRAATPTERFILHEQLDSAGLPMYGVELNEAVGWMLVRNGPAELAAVHLPRICDGTWSYAGGYSEPEAGSDMFNVRTKAVRDGGRYVINGAKLWTSAAHLADWIFALVRTDPTSERHHGLSMLLIDARSPGVEIRPVRVMGGWRVNACFFDDVSVPAGNVIGAEGEGARIIGTALDTERAMSFGGREGRLLLARFLRRMTGSAAELSDATLERLGRLVAELEVERLLNLRTSAMLERGVVAGAEASMDKVCSAELAQQVARFVADELGPVAQLADASDTLAAAAEEAVRVNTVLSIIGGTSEVQRNAIASRGLGLPKGS
ncbi:MAG TPA: acyl-CoA dehydrogenase family protein [Acidimicrobiia bacterium]|nr:acyl-CoA dehydrogenase family protein [Acidimicrobiia bacterium]